MLNIVWGRTGTGKTTYMLNDLIARAANGEQGLIWLTPEQFSHDCERLLAAKGGASLCLHAEVLTFKRLCDRVLAEFGGLSLPVLDDGGRLLNIKLAVDSVASEISLWRRSLRKAEFYKSLLKTLDECKCYRISPAILIEASQMSDGVVSDKLRELSLIFAAYDGITKSTAIDPRDRLTLLAEKLETSTYLNNKRIYIDGFVTLTPQEHTVIDTFVAKCLSCTVALKGEPSNSFFAVTKRTAERLARHSEKTVSTVLHSSKHTVKSDLLALEDMLSKRSFTLSEEKLPSEAISLFSSASPELEIENTAAIITELTENQLRYRDITVIVPDLKSYGPLVESAFERHGIPCFLDQMDDICDKPLLKYIKTAFTVTDSGWQPQDVIALLRTGLTRLSPRKADILENYILLWNLKASHWTGNKAWSLHPKGYKEKLSQDDEKTLRALNKMRILVAQPLQALKKAKTAQQWAFAITMLLKASGIPKTLKQRRKQLFAVGQAKLADENRQLWDIVMNGLQQCALVLADRELSRSEFCDFFMMLMSAYSVGTIPLSLDSVSVGESVRLRKTYAKAVIMPGCTEENMPKLSVIESLLSLEDRAALEGLSDDIDLPPDDEKRMERAEYDIYSTFTLASERLYLSYPRSKTGEDCSAVVFKKVSKCFDLHVSSLENIAKPEREHPSFRTPLSQASVKALYGENINISVSRIQKLLSCKLEFFLRYGLNSSPRKLSGFFMPDIGNFIHHILEKTGTQIDLSGGYDAVNNEQIGTWVTTAAKDFQESVLQGSDNQTRRFRFLIESLTQSATLIAENIVDEIKLSAFRPVGYEQSFSNRASQGLPSIHAYTKERFSVNLDGVIDRIDTWNAPDGKTYVRVIDYKSGTQGLDYSEVYAGVNIQLPLYLSAVVKTTAAVFEGKSLAPAGLLYIPAKEALLSSKKPITDEKALEEQKKALKRKGLILGEDFVISAMEQTEDNNFLYLPIKYKQDGSLYSTSQAADKSQLDMLLRHVDKITEVAAKALISGDVSANPLTYSRKSSECDRCDYRLCCHFDERIDIAAKINKIDKKAFFNILENDQLGGTHDE